MPVERLRTYAEIRYVGPMYYDVTSIANTTFQQGGITTWNASAAWAWTKSIDVFGSVINIFDKPYSENTCNDNQPYNRTLSMPRTISVGVRARF